MNFTYTPKNTPTSVAVVAASSNQCGISQGQAPSLSRGNYPYTGYGEGPGHPGKRPLDLVTGVPVCPAEMSGQIIGNTKSLWVEVCSLYAHPSLVSYSRCSTSRRCISFCAELRNCALSKSLISSPGLAAPRASYIGLSIAFRFCAVSLRRDVRRLRSSRRNSVGG